MIIPCPQKIDCPDTEFPLSNYSSEDPDPPIFIRAPTGGVVNFFGGGEGGPIPVPDGAPTPQNTTYSSRHGCVGDPYLELFNFGGIEPITFEVTQGMIPSWVSADVSGQTLSLTGTPTELDTGTSSYTIRATDAIGETQTKQFSADIMGLSSGSTLPAFANNTPYSTQLQSGGGAGGYTYGILSGSLPSGMTLSNTGLISGIPLVGAAPFPFTLNIRDSAGRLCTQNMKFAGNPTCVPSVPPVFDTSFALAGEAVVYVDVTDRIWLLDDGTNTMQVINPSTGIVEHSFSVAIGGSLDSMGYDSTQHRVYVTYGTVAPSSRLLILNVNTFSTVADLLLSNFGELGGDMKFDSSTNRMWIEADNKGVYVVSCASLAVTPIPNPANFFACCGVAVGGGFAVIGGGLDLGGDVRLWILNSNTLTSIGVVTIAITNDTVEAIAYSPVTSRFYVAVSGHGFYSFDAGSSNSVLIPVSGFDQSGVQYHSCRQEIVAFNGFTADHLIAYYISGTSTIANTVTTSVAPTRFSPPASNSCFDPTRARMWFASGNVLCRFT